MIGMGLCLSLGSSASSPGSTDNVLATMTAQMATATASIANNFTSRRIDYASAQGDITNIKCVHYKHYIDSTGVHSSGDHKLKIYLEYPAGVFHQVTWSAATVLDFTATSGLTSAKSDVIISSVTGLPLIIPKSTAFWWRSVNVTGSTVATFPVIVRPAGCSTLGLPDGNSASDLGNSGTITATTSANTFGPHAVIATVKKAGAKGIFLCGDSLCFGTGDDASVGAMASSGWMGRGLDGQYAHFKLGVPSITAQTLATVFTSTSLQGFLDKVGYTDFLFEAGINDLSLSSRTPAQILADHQTIYGLVKAHDLLGTPRIGQTTITARTTSTDSWATAVNQTPKTDGTYSQVTTLNTSIRAVPTGVDYVVDAADYDMTARDSVIHAGPYPCSTDGTHFTSPKSADMGSRIIIPA